MSESRILVAGLPSSGKSTYIGLLFTAIEAGQGPVSLDGFTGDFEYVNALADRLSQCEEATRTDINLAEGFNAALRFSGGEGFNLRLPDYSGETWKTALEARAWSEPVDDDVRDSSGICLFLKVGAVLNDGTIRDARRHISSLGEDHQDVEGEMPGSNEDVAPTTQVTLVDLLQVLVSRRRESYCRLSVVLSAYDLAGSVSPGTWLEMNLPLLHQYIRANRFELDTRVFGVSGQGGRFDELVSKEELVERSTLERAWVRDEEGRLVGIEEPILWAAGFGAQSV